MPGGGQARYGGSDAARPRDDDADRMNAPPQRPEDTEVSLWSRWARSVDHLSIAACVVLFCIGVILAFAASPALAENNRTEPFHYAWRHMLFGAPAFALLFSVSFFSPAAVRRLASLLTIAGLVALAMLPAYGTDFGKGGQRWFSLAGFGSVQPSELLKPALIVTCAWLLSAAAERRQAGLRLVGAGASFGLVALAAALLVIQPDYGQTALILTVWSAMYFLSGASLVTLTILGACAAAGGAVAYQIEPHLADRIEAFLDPASGVALQLQVAQDAMINGGWFGAGLGQGVQKDLLPDAHADFIFAVAVEEYGFALGAIVMGLFGFLTLNALWRLRRVEAAFPRLAGAGLALLFGLQAFVNMAVTVQLLPAKGMTLPFISYGGSSLLATGLTMGMLLALTRRRPAEQSRPF